MALAPVRADAGGGCADQEAIADDAVVANANHNILTMRTRSAKGQAGFCA
jgi:hypothetical protein